MVKRWITWDLCGSCGDPLEVYASFPDRPAVSIGDEVRCRGCRLTGRLIQDDEDVDSIYPNWNSIEYGEQNE